MTIEELLARESIRDTLAQYNMAGDRFQVENFVGVFTEDAIFEAGDTRMQGREAIRAWLTGAKRAPGDVPRVKFVRHNLTTCLIKVTGPQTAEARTYYVVFTDIGPDHCGYYVDQFRSVDGRWLISHRKVRQDWQSPDSIFARQFR
jgi:hypothetical protein